MADVGIYQITDRYQQDEKEMQIIIEQLLQNEMGKACGVAKLGIIDIGDKI